MKKIFISLLLVACVTGSFAQKKDSVDVNYRRSSLTLFLLEEDKMPQKEVIIDAFATAPCPDKFNDHNLPVRSFDVDALTIEEADNAAFQQAVNLTTNTPAADGAAPKKKSGGSFMSGLMKGAASEATGGTIGTATKEEFAIKANKYFLEQNVAKQVLDKWFLAQDSTGAPVFTIDVVNERGLYGASQSEIEKAKSSVLGMELLKSAGMELLNNSFVVACRYRYMSKDELVKMIDDAATAIAAAIDNQYAMLAVKASMLAVKASLGAGYYVVTNSYLYQLNWNDEVANSVWNVWDNYDAYKALDVAKLKYIGNESAWANVKAGIFTDKSETELIRIATINSTDAVIAKLEKKYDVFKTKTPLMVDPESGVMTAFVGTKEGLKPKDKFEVLEKMENPETKVITYKRKGVISVAKDKTQIWDNRYMADQEPDHNVDVKATTFEGNSKDFFSGMLIRQIK